MTFAALTAGSLFLAACSSGGTQPATGAAAGADNTKTIVFSPLALKIPAMKGLSEGVKGYGSSKGYTVLVQDPNLDPQKQLTDLKTVIESGKAGGAWVIAVQPSALSELVKTAQAKKVPLVLNGVPEDYGLTGLQAGLTFAKIDYTAQGTAIGESLGKCINEKLGGTAKVILTVSAAGTAGKAEVEKAQLDALKATAPGAEIVTEVIVGERAKAQTDIGNALQGNPDAKAVIGNNDEGALGAVGAFAAAGKELPCLAETGGNDEVLQAVKDGKIYASVALQFEADMVQSFDSLTAMMADPTAQGQQLATPQKVITAGSGQ
ncbi:ribose ABC transporter substrate-binding protein RbsB [Actinoplanes sichuanensis]|uniref:Sugar ABC transporter substrate-binding protein n=1 Tax=Actinoplanes sichuanensis TaxID=512349 RepID=A0ABW4AV87_9ACTN|nr:substrate-binding domain-containing protein [Actinoplanes sichuanensis]BEL04560.1 ribose ABC transporter substrate-binding protein RbsB [Actinoplanes sichuanensis]